MKLYQCLGGPGSGASRRQADPGTGLWLHKPHLAHETPNGGQRDTGVLEQITPQHWLVLHSVFSLWQERYSVSHIDDMTPRECDWGAGGGWRWMGDGEEREAVKKDWWLQFILQYVSPLAVTQLSCSTPGHCTDIKHFGWGYGTFATTRDLITVFYIYPMLSYDMEKTFQKWFVSIHKYCFLLLCNLMYSEECNLFLI